MTSSINPNNIDTTYPVAGQDNDSQGFRDNFTNIKTNFEYAETEIDDLQAKGIFKSALTGTTLDNDMAGALVENMKTQGFRGTRIALGSVTGSTAIDYAAGQWYTVTTGGSITLAFSNIPSAGNASWFNVRITVASIAHTVTLPAAVGASASAQSIVGIQGIVGQVITFAQTGTYEFEFHTDDGGTTIYLSELTRPRNDFSGTISVTGTATVGNVSTGGTVSATGNVTGGNLNTGGAVVATGAVQGGSLTDGTLTITTGAITSATNGGFSGTLTATGNVTGGNLNTGGTVNATGPLFVSSSEDLADAGAASLTVATSYFTTAAAETSTLAAGTAGQIKTFAAVDVSAGNMVITVTNPAWGGSGTITFNTAGQACTLQYVNSKWFCTGNNGGTFA